MTELVLSPAGRRYGLLPSPPDHRDFGLASFSQRLITPSSGSVADLEPWCGPAKDQGRLGGCTAFAGTGNLEYLYCRFQGQSIILSPLFLYYVERQLDGDVGIDGGSTGRTSCRAMSHFGVCLETEDVYDPLRFSLQPTADQIAEAMKHTSGAYHSLSTVADIRSCIATGYPCLVGFTVYESFENEQTANTGIMPQPNKAKERVLGGHEVLFIGFDDSRQAFKVRNSWGANWGDKGNFWFPYSAAADPDILIDGWIQHLGRAWA
jgi:C1A family cysteine protease